MTNIYWPVFKNLERNVIDLSFSIHIDDTQLDVYSSKITDLILRAAAEIESLAKELYKLNGGPKTGQIKYDDDAIKFLKNLWLLDRKKVIVSNPNCFQTNKVHLPFVKNETRTGTVKQTFSWNNAYQNLKHDRANSLHFGSVRYLFDIMSALYVLNIYFKDENFDLEKDSRGTTFPIGVGSELFSVQLKSDCSHRGDEYIKGDDFDESIYFVNWTDESSKPFREGMTKINQMQLDGYIKHPKTQEHFSNPENVKDLQAGKMPNFLEILGDEEHQKIMLSAIRSVKLPSDQLQYEAVLNKNQTPV